MVQYQSLLIIQGPYIRASGLGPKLLRHESGPVNVAASMRIRQTDVAVLPLKPKPQTLVPKVPLNP